MKETISTPNAPNAIGPYSQGVKANGFVFTSGQLPMNPATGELEKNDIKKATALVLENVKNILEAGGLGLENVVKATVFLRDMANFAAMNEVYGTYFGRDCPARSAVQVAALPLGVPIEIEVIAAV